MVWLEANEAFDQDIRVCGFYEKIKECNITFEPELNMQWSKKTKTKKFYPWLRASQLFIILMRQQNLELVHIKDRLWIAIKKVFLKDTPLRALYDNFWIFDPTPIILMALYSSPLPKVNIFYGFVNVSLQLSITKC